VPRHRLAAAEGAMKARTIALAAAAVALAVGLALYALIARPAAAAGEGRS